MAVLARLLKPLVKRGRLTVINPDGSRETFGTPDPDLNEVTMRVVSNAAARRILLNPGLGAPEAYMNGELVIEEGEIWDLIALYDANKRWEGGKRKKKGPLLKAASKVGNYVRQANDKVRSKQNVAHHYDLGNDFYRLFLDEDMQYSCAYFPTPDTPLEEAQRAKKAHIAAKLALEPGQRVLDIGCGWGGMALYLNRVADVAVHGITLSEEQYALACERANKAGVADKVTFELVDYRDLAERDAGKYDRIVSVGMFEHVGQPQFDTFFKASSQLMKSDGVMLLHTIGRYGQPGSTDPFTRKYIFPGGYIPALSETAAASQKTRLIAADVETLRVHYGWTLRHWYDRTVANRDKIVAMYDERFYRMWLMYLSGAGAAFFWGRMGNFQIQYLKNRYAVPMTRNYMLEKEAEYLAKG